MAGKTLFDKIWDAHAVESPTQEAARLEALREAAADDSDGLLGERQEMLYIDLHLIHEVTSPQAFEGLRMAGRPVRRPGQTLATVDHNIPTIGRDLPNPDPLSHQQIEVLRKNCEEFGVTLFDMFDPRQGIVHIIGPEQGFTQPGHDNRLRR